MGYFERAKDVAYRVAGSKTARIVGIVAFGAGGLYLAGDGAMTVNEGLQNLAAGNMDVAGDLTAWGSAEALVGVASVGGALAIGEAMRQDAREKIV